MPRGASVQRATQSTKPRSVSSSGGRSYFAITLLRLPGPAAPAGATDQTTPKDLRVESGTSTQSPGERRSAGGAK